MTQAQRLNDTIGVSVYYHDGLVRLEFWPESRPAGGDPIRFDLSPGEALDMAAKLIPCAKNAILMRLGGKS